MKFFELFSKKKIILCVSQILVLVLALLVTSRTAQYKCEVKFSEERAELVDAYEHMLNSMSKEAEEGLYLSNRLSDEHKAEAEALARLIQGTIPNHPDSSKEALCWLVFNRIEDPIFPDTVIGVIEQKGQFDTYSPDEVITEANYTLAHNELSKYYNGDFRPVAPGFVYLTCSSTGVVLRDNWDTKRAHEWRS